MLSNLYDSDINLVVIAFVMRDMVLHSPFMIVLVSPRGWVREGEPRMTPLLTSGVPAAAGPNVFSGIANSSQGERRFPSLVMNSAHSVSLTWRRRQRESASW
jgi:hypothetical protein